MEENDPFAAITKLCQVSASQEQHLNHCPFALEPQTNDEPLSLDAETPVASTPITMVSPPQTPVDNHKDDLYVNSALQDGDVFTTPPEEPFLSRSHKQHEQQVVEEEEVAFNHGKEDRRDERTVTDEKIAVDDGDCEESSREMDLGFTVEAELTERIETEGDSGGSEDNSQDKEVTHCKYMKGESSSKRSKLHGNNLGLATPEPSLRSEIGKSLKRLVKSWDKFKWTPRVSVGAEPVKYDERYAGPANVYGEDVVTEKRVLPASVHGRKGDEGSGKAEHDTVFSEMTCMDLQITLLDVLKILAENEHYDPSLEKLSILDAAKIGGMTFP
ncbi:hypothetical protein IMY05_003G0048800 [Salix suchowensis]|nr:hypothetical protein IMY05_003G0048800 [Salix suchowensis]